MNLKNPKRGTVVVTLKHQESAIVGESLIYINKKCGCGSPIRLAINAPKKQMITRHKMLETQQIMEALKTYNICDLNIRTENKNAEANK